LLTIKDQIRVVYCNKEIKGFHLAETKEDLFIFLKEKIAEYEALRSKYSVNKLAFYLTKTEYYRILRP